MKKLFITTIPCLFYASLCLLASCQRATVTPTPIANDPYVAKWQVHDNQSASVAGNHSYDYVINITKSSAANEILINSFAGDNSLTVTASINGNNFTIPQQNANVGTTMGISGSGTVNGNSISYTYSLTREPKYGGNSTSSCTGTRK